MSIPSRVRCRSGASAPIAPISTRSKFAPFAALILIAHVAGKADATTAFCAIAFFWLRLAHAVVYWLGLPFIRTLVFTLGWIVVVVLFFQVVR